LRPKIMKKNKIWIIVILLSVLALSLVVVLLKFLEIENKSAYVIKQNGVSESESEKIKVASGWSVNEDSKKAVDEAMYSIRLGLNGQSPDFLIVQATEGIDYSTVIGEIHTVWPSVQIFGGTSHLATLTDDGYHQGESGSLSLLGVVSEKIEFAVGGSSFADYSSPEKAVEEAIGLATADFSEEKPELVFMTSAPGFEEKVLLEIKKILGPDVPVFGGSSADNEIKNKWRQFANGRIYSEGVSLAMVYIDNKVRDDIKISWASQSGYDLSEQGGLITRAEGRIIYEIDNRPAAEVYNNWTGGKFSQELISGGSILNKSNIYPLSKVLANNGKINYLTIHPASIDADKGSLEVFAEVRAGDKIVFRHGDWETLLNRTSLVVEKALNKKEIDQDSVCFALYDFCGGALGAIPKTERTKIPALISEKLIKAPYLGMFTFGEQFFLEGVGNTHQNLVSSVIIFCEE